MRFDRLLAWAGVLLVLLLAGTLVVQDQAGSRADFSFYLLDLTYEAGWCEDGNQRREQCRMLDRRQAAARPLVLHGLWPEFDAPGSYPSFCEAGALRLSPALWARLEAVMPGASEGLHRHEWRKHGGCTGLDSETYFAESIRLYERAVRSLAPPLRAAMGREFSGAMLRAEVRKVDPELAASLQLVCKNPRGADPRRRQRPYLLSVRVCVDNDGAGGRPASLLACQAVQRRDQGCGVSFFVDDI